MAQGIPGAALRQRVRLLEAQQAFLSEFPALSGEEAASRHSHLQAAFSIEQGGRKLHPAFQFDEGGVRPVITQLRSAFGQKAQGWSLALWLISANGWLDGLRPIDLLDEQPKAVLTAASHAAAEIL